MELHDIEAAYLEKIYGDHISHILLVVSSKLCLHGCISVTDIHDVLFQATDTLGHIGTGVVYAVHQLCMVFLTVVIEHGIELAENFILGFLLADHDLL